MSKTTDGADLMSDGPKPVSIGEQMAKLAEQLDKQKETVVQGGSGRNSDARAPRETREMTSREADAAPKTWRPADVLPDPPQRDGFVHRWVRGSSRGEQDAVNVARAMREGWRPCVAEDYPEVVAEMFGRSESSTTIEYGGLILCRLPIELAKQRQAYFDGLSTRQITSVNQRLAEEQRDENRIKYENGSRSVVNSVAPT